MRRNWVRRGAPLWCGLGLLLLPWLAAAAPGEEGPPLATGRPAAEAGHGGHGGHGGMEGHGGHRGQAARAWSALPMLAPRGGGGRAAMTLSAFNISPTRVRLLDSAASHPDGVELHAERGAIQVAPAERGYHLVVAEEQRGEETLATASVLYFSGPAPAPRPMLGQSLGGLEIVPAQLPREHGQLRAGERWPFQVRYRGRNLSGAAVELTTELGDRLEGTSGPDGVVTFTLPQRFTPPVAGDHGSRSRTRFLLAVRHEEGGQRFLSTFHHHYAPPADDGKNGWLGLGFLVLGMGLAAPLLWRRGGGA